MRNLIKDRDYDKKFAHQFQILIGLPISSRGSKVVSNSKKAMRFLIYQDKRLTKLVNEGNFVRVVRIYLILMKISVSYQVALYNRCFKAWHWKRSSKDALKEMASIIQRMRKMDLELHLKRFYIKKKNGKLRPIGSPDVYSKVVSLALTRLTSEVMEGHREDFQHAYRNGRGVHTLVLDFIKNYDGSPLVEFDLKSFFNKVNPSYIPWIVRRVSDELARVITIVNQKVVYSFTKLEDEAELVEIKKIGYPKPIIKRSGLPQGLSLSPILSTLLLDLHAPDFRIWMYADDGIACCSMERLKVWESKGKSMGLEIAWEKTKEIKDSFSFVGMTIDLKNKTIEYNGVKMSWYSEKLPEFVKTVYNKYGTAPRGWSWEINKESYTWKTRHVKLSVFEKIIVWWKSIW
jgi:hypothetical protein